MAASRLTDSQKSELVARYSAGESSAELAASFACSVNTVSRVVKAALPPEEYERLKQLRVRGGRGAASAAQDSPAHQEIAPIKAAVVEQPAAEAEDPANAADASAVDVEAALAIDDADDFGDEGADDEADDEEPGDEALDLGTAAVSQEPVSCIPLAEAELPASVYMLVDKTVELDARPLAAFSELGALPPGEEERQALQVFVNPRQAKRLCGRSQRVIKIPDTRIFERTARYLLAQGISRVVIENGVYSLPGA